MATNNPYDFSQAAQVNTGLLASQMPQTQGSVADMTMTDKSPYNPATTNAKGTTQASTYNAATGTAEGYDATKATGTNWNVDANQTVAGQLDSILASNNPLLQRAQTKALQDMNSRGLLNSSMAIGAGQAALYDAALPIAQADASTFGSAGKYNADVANTTSQFNANADNTAKQFTAGAKNAQTQQNTAAENASRSQNAQQTQAASQANATAQNALQSQLLTTQAQIDQANSDAKNKYVLQKSAQDFQGSMANYDAVVKSAMQNADAASKLQLQQIDAQTRTGLADIEARYKNQMQASQSAAQMYQQTVKNITDITMDKDLDAGGKQVAIQKQIDMLKSGFQLQENVSGLDLGNILNFDQGAAALGGNNNNGAAPATTQPVQNQPQFNPNAPQVGDSIYGATNGVPNGPSIAKVGAAGSVLNDGSYLPKGSTSPIPSTGTTSKVGLSLMKGPVDRWKYAALPSGKLNSLADGSLVDPATGARYAKDASGVWTAV